MNRYDIL